MKKLIYTAILGLSLMCGSCTDFLEDQPGNHQRRTAEEPGIHRQPGDLCLCSMDYRRRYQLFLLHVEL